MPLVLSPLALVGILAIVAVLSFVVIARVPLTGRNLLILLVGFAVIVMIAFDWSSLVVWSQQAVHTLHVFSR